MSAELRVCCSSGRPGNDQLAHWHLHADRSVGPRCLCVDLSSPYARWLCAAALLLSALLGHMQDSAYKQYGKAWRGTAVCCLAPDAECSIDACLSENMFYSHFVALPGFLLVAPDIWEHAVKWQTEQGVPADRYLRPHPVCSTHRRHGSLCSLAFGLASAVGYGHVRVSLWVVLGLNLLLQ